MICYYSEYYKSYVVFMQNESHVWAVAIDKHIDSMNKEELHVTKERLAKASCNFIQT